MRSSVRRRPPLHAWLSVSLRMRASTRSSLPTPPPAPARGPPVLRSGNALFLSPAPRGLLCACADGLTAGGGEWGARALRVLLAVSGRLVSVCLSCRCEERAGCGAHTRRGQGVCVLSAAVGVPWFGSLLPQGLELESDRSGSWSCAPLCSLLFVNRPKIWIPRCRLGQHV